MAQPALTRQQYKEGYARYLKLGQPDKAQKVLEQFQAAYPQQQPQQQPQPQQQQPQGPVDFDIGTMVSNIPSSLYNVAADTAQAVMNPIDTAYAIGNLAKSGIHNAAQELNEFVGPEATLAMNRFGNAIGLDRRPETLEELQGYQIEGQGEGEAFAGALDERYGSLDNAKRSLMEDPAGVMLDVASLATGAGAGVRAGLKNRGKDTQIADSVMNAGSGLAPLSGSVRAPVGALEQVMGQPISRKLYQSAMKPSTTLPEAERARLLDAGIEVGATPTKRSVDKVQRKKEKLGAAIGEAEGALTQKDVEIPASKLFTYVDEVERDFVPLSPNAKNNMNKIDKVVEDMMDGIFFAGGRLTPQDVAKIKRNIYKTVSYDKKLGDNRKIDDVQEATLKAIAKAAREQLEMLDPELAQLNAAYGNVSEVQRKIQNPAAARVGNRDLIGIGAPIKAAAGAATGGGPGAVLGALQGIIDAPTIKSNLAIGANRIGNVLRDSTFQKLELAAGQGGRLEEEALSQFDKDMDAIMSGMLDTRTVR
tara:strand:+ start:984 stop:2585 length:1602 start_codon:yes stop_codon:yes gene_type:complete